MDLLEVIRDKLNQQKEAPRNYVGASSIGGACMRKVYYDFHKSDKAFISEKQKITFKMGHALENMLKQIFFECGLLDDSFNLAVQDPVLTQFKGHMDCVLKFNNTIYVCDIKTCNHQQFMAFKRNKLKDWHYEYYVQLQCYMGMSGIHQAILIAIDKDSSTLHYEIVEFDMEIYEKYKMRAIQIMEAKIPPPRISNKATWYQCKMCFYHQWCHFDEENS